MYLNGVTAKSWENRIFTISQNPTHKTAAWYVKRLNLSLNYVIFVILIQMLVVEKSVLIFHLSLSFCNIITSLSHLQITCVQYMNE